MNGENAIIVFVRTPVYGQVKTRLAASIGPAKALRVYELLLRHTYSTVKQLNIPVYVYYAGDAAPDGWRGSHFFFRQQSTGDLGSRMQQAFAEVFAMGHRKVIILGSDCYELTAAILKEAFAALNNTAAVLGPAADGGYYLLGLTQQVPALFTAVAWSTATVLNTTLQRLQLAGISPDMLPLLKDVDEEKDLPEDIIKQLGC